MDHTFFLWSAFAFTAGVIGIEVLGLYLRRKRAKQNLKSRTISG